MARIVLVAIVVAVVAGAAIVAGVIVARDRNAARGHARALRIDDAPEHWAKDGFARMTPPIRLPTDQAGDDEIVVWLKVGTGSIATRTGRDGEPTLVFPPGTIADRVESVGGAVVDVRGTTITGDDDDKGAELFHVYVDEAEAPSALVGWEWRRGDVDAEVEATHALLDRLRVTKRRMQGAPEPSAEAQRASLVAYERNNACGACHVHEKPFLPEGNVVHRKTDANGFFVPLSVLSDSAPLERHRPVDANAGAPFLSMWCPSGGAPTQIDAPIGDTVTRHFACRHGEIPKAKLDVVAALAAGDDHARAVCNSRAYLRERMNDEARVAFADAFAECGLR